MCNGSGKAALNTKTNTKKGFSKKHSLRKKEGEQKRTEDVMKENGNGIENSYKESKADSK